MAAARWLLQIVDPVAGQPRDHEDALETAARETACRQAPAGVSRRTRSILLSARIARRPLAASRSTMCRVSGSAGRAASTSSTIRSASAAPLQAAATIARSSRRRGAKMPGVSTKTSCAGPIDGDAEQPAAGRLHLGRDDRQLLPDELVEQRRFAGIGRADQRDIAAAAFRRSDTLGSAHLASARQFEQRRRGRGLGGALRRGGGAGLIRLPATRAATVKRGAWSGPLVVDQLDRPAAPGRAPAPIPAASSSGRCGGASISAMQRLPPALDEGRGRGQPAIEIDRGDHRLADIGEDRRVAARRPRRPRPATACRCRSSPIARGDPRQRVAAHQMR